MNALILAFALTADEPRDQVLELLDTTGSPVYAEAFTTAAGGDPSAILASIVADDELPPPLRQSAVAAMSSFKSDAGKSALLALMGAGFSPLRKTAVLALGRDYKGAPDAYAALVHALGDQEVVVRKAAVKMLAVSPQPRAKSVLADRAQTETQASVRLLIEKLLK